MTGARGVAATFGGGLGPATPRLTRVSPPPLPQCAVYEDRYDLWGLAPQSRLRRQRVRVKRSEEFRRLQGAQALVGAWLELTDVAHPLCRRVLQFAGEAVAFLLVQLIGRAIGLVVRGIRESVRPGAGSGALGGWTDPAVPAGPAPARPGPADDDAGDGYVLSLAYA